MFYYPLKGFVTKTKPEFQLHVLWRDRVREIMQLCLELINLKMVGFSSLILLVF